MIFFTFICFYEKIFFNNYAKKYTFFKLKKC